MLVTFSRKIARNKQLAKLLNNEIVYVSRLKAIFYRISKPNITGIIAWKKKFKAAKEFAQKRSIQIISVEESFVSSMHNRYGKQLDMGFYIDFLGGKYYSSNDKTEASTLLNNAKWQLSPELESEVEACISLILEHKIVKYNNFEKETDAQGFSIEEGAASILLIDQVLNDASVTTNKNGPEDFKKMYMEAQKLAKGKKVYIKLHPKNDGYLKNIAREGQAIFLDPNYNIFDILNSFTDVFTVSSAAGFDALLMNKKVHVFGKPFYAGMGLTNDYSKIIKRKKRSVKEIFFAYYIHSCRYIIEDIQCSLREILGVIAENKRIYKQDKDTRFFVWDIIMWKRKRFVDYLFSNNIVFVKTFKQMKHLHLNPKDNIVVWGKPNKIIDVENFASKNGVKLLTCEDGFIRSVGLGSNFVYPNSLVFDSKGIYFDCRQASEIEEMLNSYNLSKEDILRAGKLVSLIEENNITKFNINQNSEKIIEDIKKASRGKKIILITGQVADDKSISYGSINIARYIDLLKLIKAKFPKAFIVYKPHPDVIEMNRRGFIPSSILKLYADYVYKLKDITPLFKIVDSIHTITSLSGFEAIIRKKTVYTYGLPFYAGYGLTLDLEKSSRRVKKRSLEDLVFIALAKYSRHYTPVCHIFLTPEILIKKILSTSYHECNYSYFMLKKIQLLNLLKLFVASVRMHFLKKN